MIKNNSTSIQKDVVNHITSMTYDELQLDVSDFIRDLLIDPVAISMPEIDFECFIDPYRQPFQSAVGLICSYVHKILCILPIFYVDMCRLNDRPLMI